jgi:hypothetical protein
VSSGVDLLNRQQANVPVHRCDPRGQDPIRAATARAPRQRRRTAFPFTPDLAPAAVSMTKPAGRTGSGEIFLAPQQGPLQNGPMILDPDR